MALQTVLRVTLLAVISATVVEGRTVQEGDCPPWFKWMNTSEPHYCACVTLVKEYIVCDQQNQTSSLRQGACIFYNSNISDVVVGACSFFFPKSLIKEGLISLPRNVSKLNKFVCGSLKREEVGPLCGKCTNNTGPSVYSVGNECVPCRAVNVVYYILLQYLPTTLLFLIIMVFRPNITEAPMAHYVLFCNTIVLYCRFMLYTNYTDILATDSPYILALLKSVLTLNAVWSFDTLFFVSPPLCISPHFQVIYKSFLEFLATLYPFILLLLTYVATELHARDFTPVVALWRPFHRIYVRFYTTWGPNTSIIQAFSSLFFLSYAKLNFIMCEPFLWSTVQNTEGQAMSRVVYIDPTIPYMSKRHIFVVLFSIFVAVFLYLPPLFLLIIYPTALYRKCSHKIKSKWRIAIKTYVETFQGCYKDGTNGTCDYRALSGYQLGLGSLLLAVQAVFYKTLPTRFVVVSAIVTLTVLTILCSLLQPYKRRSANVSAVTLLAIMTTHFALCSSLYVPKGSDVLRMMIFILLVSPHCTLCSYIVWKLRCCRKHQQMDDGEGDWLLSRSRHSSS